MAGNCIIPVDTQYLLGLQGAIKQCHQEGSESYRQKRITGFACCDTCNISLSNLLCLSDILFYLDMYIIADDDCKNVHKVKQEAMKICKFSEADILDNLFLNSLLTEAGEPILLESGTEYIELE